MSLFTSISKTWIRQSLVTTALIFCGYTILTSAYFRPFGGGNAQSGWQINIIRSQRYAYDIKDPKIVVVGTSLSDKLHIHLLGNQVYNLATAFFATHTGLEIVKRKRDKPKVIMIEGNYLSTGSANPDYIRALYDPIMHPLRTKVRAFREEYRPTEFMKFLLRNLASANPYEVVRGMPQRIDLQRKSLRPYDSAQFDALQLEASAPLDLNHTPLQLLQSEQKRQGTATHQNYERIEESPNILEIKKYVDALVSEGTKPVFYFVPQPKSGIVTRNLLTAIEVTKRFFPEIPTIIDLDETRYQLEDAIHLDAISAARYTLYLRGKIEELFGTELGNVPNEIN